MFTKAGSDPVAADSVVAAEGNFQYRPGYEVEPVIKVKMVYTRRDTGETYGYCPVRSSMFSPRTMELFMKFLESAESDYGKVFFGGGVVEPSSKIGIGHAETEVGLGPKGLGDG